jgi:hypothetical protein
MIKDFETIPVVSGDVAIVVAQLTSREGEDAGWEMRRTGERLKMREKGDTWSWRTYDEREGALLQSRLRSVTSRALMCYDEWNSSLLVMFSL